MSAGRKQPSHNSNEPRRGSKRRVEPHRVRADYTLKTLVEELSERANGGESQESLIEWLRMVTGGMGIRLRHDVHRTAEALNAAAAADVATADAATADVATADAAAADAAAAGAATADAAAAGAATADAPPEKPRKGRGRVRRELDLPVTYEQGRLVMRLSGDMWESARDNKLETLGDSDTFVGRIILSCDRRNVRTDSILCAECNGAVIDACTWKLLSVPPRAFATRIVAREVNKGFAIAEKNGAIKTGIYDVVQVSDGTVVNLYRWDHPTAGPVWCMNSSNGYDVSHLKWMGEKTYAEVIYELLSAHDAFVAATGVRLAKDVVGAGDVRLDFASLDPAYSYSIGFRHPNFHPMGADRAAVWNIQAADLQTGRPDYLVGLPHIPRQAVFGREAIICLAEAYGRRGVGAEGTAIQMADLDHILRTALEDAKMAIAGKDTRDVASILAASGLDLGTDVHLSSFNYGFILRSRDQGLTGVYSDILCESPLLRRVRQLVYQRPARQIRDELNEKSRLEYNIIKAFLTTTDREDFLALFPNFKDKLDTYAEFVANVIHLVIQIQRQNAMAVNGRSAGKVARTHTMLIAQTILNHLLANEKDFKPFQEDAESIVHDYVVRPEYATLYLRAIGLP